MYRIKSSVPIQDNVEVSIHDIDDLRKEVPGWDSLSKLEKMEAARNVDAIEEDSASNTTCIGLHEYIVDNLDSNQSVNESVSHLAVGDNDTAPASGNVNLNNEVGRFSVTSVNDAGSLLDISTFLDTSEANGNTLKEIGLTNQATVSGDILFNHSTISDIVKTSNKTATIDVTLEFEVPTGPAGEITMTTLTKTANYTANNEEIILGDASAGPITITMPAPDNDIFVYVKKIDSTANSVDIASPGSENIDDSASNISLTAQYASRTITSDSADYFII